MLTLPGIVRTVSPLSDARHALLYLQVFHHRADASLTVHADGEVRLIVPGLPDVRFILDPGGSMAGGLTLPA